jgi:hypothetical protein
MFFSPPTSGWEDLPLLEDVPTWDDAPSPRRNLVPPRTPATPQHNRRFHPYHPDARLPANVLLTPPSPSFNSPSHRFSSQIQNSITQALENGWAKSTLAGYSQHVTHFLAFCKQEEVPAALQFPADEFVLCAYAASDAGRVSASTIQNRLSGLKAWHNAHGATWNGGLRLQVVINGAKNLAPSSSKKPPRPPITVAMLQRLFDGLDLTKPLDAAVAACALLAFWGQCRLGELLSTSALDLSTTSKPARSHFNHSTRSIGSHTLALPRTKTNRNGEKVVLVPRSDSLDPISHVRSHLATSTLPSNLPLLAYSTPSGPRMLTKATFLARCNQVWMASGYPRTTGHSFRIGGTTELLTSGVPPDVVKSMGRWSSDSFLRYWRDLETIAPLHARNAYRKKPGRSSGGI